MYVLSDPGAVTYTADPPQLVRKVFIQPAPRRGRGGGGGEGVGPAPRRVAQHVYTTANHNHVHELPARCRIPQELLADPSAYFRTYYTDGAVHPDGPRFIKPHFQR